MRPCHGKSAPDFFLSGHLLSVWNSVSLELVTAMSIHKPCWYQLTPGCQHLGKAESHWLSCCPVHPEHRKRQCHSTSIPCHLVNQKEAASPKHRDQFLVPQVNQRDGIDKRKQSKQSDQTRPPSPKSVAFHPTQAVGSGLEPLLM